MLSQKTTKHHKEKTNNQTVRVQNRISICKGDNEQN